MGLNLIGGYITNEFLGQGQQQVDFTDYRASALDYITNLQNQVPTITSWAEGEKNFVDLSKEIDVQNVSDSARMDSTTMIENIQQLDVKTGFDSSGIIESAKTDETEAIYDAMNKAYTEFDLISEREKSGIDFNVEQMMNQIQNQISNIGMQVAGTTGEALEFTGLYSSGYTDPADTANTYENMDVQDQQALLHGTGQWAGTTPNPYSMSGSDWIQAQGGNVGMGTYVTGLGGDGGMYGQPDNPGGFNPSGRLGQNFIWEENPFAPAGEQLGQGIQGYGTANYNPNVTGPGSDDIWSTYFGMTSGDDNLFTQMNTPDNAYAISEGGGPDYLQGGITSSGYYNPNNMGQGSYMPSWQQAGLNPGYTPGSGGMYGTYSGGYNPTGNWSDRRLKTNIELVGKSSKGYNIYEFEYIDNSYGPDRYRGVMSDEVEFAIITQDKDGYDLIDYNHPDLDVPFERIS